MITKLRERQGVGFTSFLVTNLCGAGWLMVLKLGTLGRKKWNGTQDGRIVGRSSCCGNGNALRLSFRYQLVFHISAATSCITWYQEIITVGSWHFKGITVEDRYCSVSVVWLLDLILIEPKYKSNKCPMYIYGFSAIFSKANNNNK